MGAGFCLPCGRRKKDKRKIVLLLAGLDNAGKSTAAKGLANENVEAVLPTVGFTSITLTHRGYDVTIYDVGGSPQIRAIWSNYFSDVHGLIFVIDSSDESRIDESKCELENMLSHDKLAGKPVLLLANKQDIPGAMDEIDIVEKLCLERLVNEKKCPTLVEICSAMPHHEERHTIDPGLLGGYRWLLGHIIKEYDSLNVRVEEDHRKEQERIAKERQAWRENKKRELEATTTANEQENVPFDGFRPINEVIQSLEASALQSCGNGNQMESQLNKIGDSQNKISNGLNGHISIEVDQINSFASEVREQLVMKGKLQRRKMTLVHRSNKINPQSELPPVILPGPRGPLSSSQNRGVLALTSPTPRESNLKLPPLRPPNIRPLTSRSLGNEGRAWGLDESLEVVLPFENILSRKTESDAEEIVSGTIPQNVM